MFQVSQRGRLLIVATSTLLGVLLVWWALSSEENRVSAEGPPRRSGDATPPPSLEGTGGPSSLPQEARAPGSAPGLVTAIRVVDSDGGAIPDALVELTPQGKFGATGRATTDMGGVAAFPRIQPGLYEARARADGYVTAIAAFQLPGHQVLRLDFGSRLILDLESPGAEAWKTTRITVRRKDLPLTSHRQLDGTETEADMGSWPPGLVCIDVTSQGTVRPRSTTVLIPPSTVVRVPLAPLSDLGFRFELADPSGARIEEWTLVADVFRGMAPPLRIPSEEGVCRVALGPHNVMLRAESAGRPPVFVLFEAGAPSAAIDGVHRLRAVDGVDLTVAVDGAGEARLDVFLLGQALPNEVRIRKAPQKSTNAVGSLLDLTVSRQFREIGLVAQIALEAGQQNVGLQNLPPMSRLALVVHGARHGGPRYVDVGRGGVTTGISCKSGAAARARVVDGNGNPLEGASVLLFVGEDPESADRLGSLRTSPSGALAIRGLRRGTKHILLGTFAGLRGTTTFVPGADGAAVDLVLEPDRRARMDVRVQAPDGTPVSGARVGRYEWDRSGIWALTDAQGNARLVAGSPGRGIILATHAAYHPLQLHASADLGSTVLTLVPITRLVVECATAPVGATLCIRLLRWTGSEWEARRTERFTAPQGGQAVFSDLRGGKWAVETWLAGHEGRRVRREMTLEDGAHHAIQGEFRE